MRHTFATAKCPARFGCSGGRGTSKLRDMHPPAPRACPYIGFPFRCSQISTSRSHAHGWWHLRSIVGMIEAGRPCLDIAQQLHAVEKAVCQAKKTLIHDHIDQCLEQAAGPVPRDQRGPIDGFKAITKYL